MNRNARCAAASHRAWGRQMNRYEAGKDPVEEWGGETRDWVFPLLDNPRYRERLEVLAGVDLTRRIGCEPCLRALVLDQWTPETLHHVGWCDSCRTASIALGKMPAAPRVAGARASPPRRAARAGRRRRDRRAARGQPADRRRRRQSRRRSRSRCRARRPRPRRARRPRRTTPGHDADDDAGHDPDDDADHDARHDADDHPDDARARSRRRRR